MKEGRKPEPTASVIDTQSVKTSGNVPLTSQGTDAAKKTSDAEVMSSSCRKRGPGRAWESDRFVEADTRREAVVEAADHAAEAMPRS